MERFEYKVVTAPRRGQKARGVKTAEDRFSLALETAINALAAEGWEYLRSELLPQDERSGLTGTQTLWRNVLVFRRALAEGAAAASEAAPAARPRVEPQAPAPLAAAAGPGLAIPATVGPADRPSLQRPDAARKAGEATADPEDDADDEADTDADEAGDATEPHSGIDRLMRRRLRRPPDMPKD